MQIIEDIINKKKENDDENISLISTNPSINSSKSGWKMFYIKAGDTTWKIYVSATTVFGIFFSIHTAGSSVAQLFGKLVPCNDGKTANMTICHSSSIYGNTTTTFEGATFAEFMGGDGDLLKTVLVDIMTLLIEISATLGIAAFNISGLKGLATKILDILKSKSLPTLSKNLWSLVELAIFATFSGTAMGVLAGKYNWPFLVRASFNGEAPQWVNVTEKIVEYITWAMVGSSIGGALQYSWRKYIVPSIAPNLLYGKEKQQIEGLCNVLRKEVQLELYGKDVKEFNKLFLRALELTKTASPDEIKNKFKEIFADKDNTIKFFKKFYGILCLSYPSTKDHPYLKALILISSLVLSSFGAYSLKNLTASGFPGAVGETFGWAAFVTNAWLWTNSLYEAWVVLLNPQAALGDTITGDLKFDHKKGGVKNTFIATQHLSTRASCLYLSGTFGLMMALIPMLSNSSWALKLPQIISGFGVNLIIGFTAWLGIARDDLGLLGKLDRDKANEIINLLEQALLSLSQPQQKEALEWTRDRIQKAISKLTNPSNERISKDPIGDTVAIRIHQNLDQQETTFTGTFRNTASFFTCGFSDLFFKKESRFSKFLDEKEANGNLDYYEIQN